MGGGAEESGVTDVQEVEASVGEDDFLAEATSSSDFECEHLAVELFAGEGAIVIHEIAQDFFAREESHADAFDLEAAGDVTQACGFEVVAPCRQAEAHDGEDHIAGTCNVVHLACACGHQFGMAIGSDQGHAIPIERDQGAFQVQIAHEGASGVQRILGAIDRDAGCEGGLEPVGGHACDAAVPGIVASADGIDEDFQIKVVCLTNEVIEQAGSTDALVVVGDEHHVDGLQGGWEMVDEEVFDLRGDGPAFLVVDPDHLLRVTIRCPADVAFLERGGSIIEGDHELLIDLKLFQESADQVCFWILADDAHERDGCFEGAQHGRHG